MTITLTREEAQQVLDALEELNKLSIGENAICLPAEIDNAMETLRDRLAEPYRQQAETVFAETNGRMTIDPVTGDVGIGWASGPEKNGGA